MMPILVTRLLVRIVLLICLRMHSDYSVFYLIRFNHVVLFHYCRCCCNKAGFVDSTKKFHYGAFV